MARRPHQAGQRAGAGAVPGQQDLLPRAGGRVLRRQAVHAAVPLSVPAAARQPPADGAAAMDAAPVAPAVARGRAAPDGGSFECAICLGTGDGPGVVHALSCGHSFCRSCIGRHIATRWGEGQRARCPKCMRELERTEVPAEVLAGAGKQVWPENCASVSSHDAVQESASSSRAFLKLAQRMHLKQCPACAAPIQKEGGCDHMRCHCGFIFRWSEAATLAPCHRLHTHPDLPLWGAVCPNCSRVASAKLIAWRGMVVAGSMVAVPILLATGAAFVLACEGSRLTMAACDCICDALETDPQESPSGCHRHFWPCL